MLNKHDEESNACYSWGPGPQDPLNPALHLVNLLNTVLGVSPPAPPVRSAPNHFNKVLWDSNNIISVTLLELKVSNISKLL